MKKKLQLKKLGLVMMMSLIVMSVLSVTSYAYTKMNLTLLADTSDHFISANDGTVEYTTEFPYGHSYKSATDLWLTGYVSASANTDRGSTLGGSIRLSVQKKYLFFWVTQSSEEASSSLIVIENVPTPMTYTIETPHSQYGSCAYKTGETYRGRFEVGYLCAPSNASKVKVHPAMNYTIYADWD